MNDFIKLSEYRNWLRDLKQQIKTGQIKAAISVNSQLILLYWDLGRQIAEKQEKAKWGSGFIEQLSKDLRAEFPEMTGFSRANLFRMQKFYRFYSSIINQVKDFVAQPVRQNNVIGEQIFAQVVRKLQPADFDKNTILPQFGRELGMNKILLIPWGHNVCIIEKVKDLNQALFYINKTIENNWSRAVLEYQIETNLYGRQGKAVTNFSLTLPEPQSDLANEMMKDPFNFGFIRLSEKVRETDLEKALVQHISQFLLELGKGFAYMGRQFTLKVGEDEYRTDLLFYHTRLVKDEHDKPTIGMLLCKNKNNYAVEFSLKDVNNPIGVSTFHYTELSDDIKDALPSAEELQDELLNFEREHAKDKP